MKVYFAADHAGFDLKNALLNFVRGELRHDTEDCGAFEKDPNDDYPEIVASACRLIVSDIKDGLDSRGIILGASGQGEAMAANRFNGIRCSVYYGETTQQVDASGHTFNMLESVRGHNNANVLSLAARFLTEEAAKKAVREWLGTPFTGEERHMRRIEKLDTLQHTKRI